MNSIEITANAITANRICSADLIAEIGSRPTSFSVLQFRSMRLKSVNAADSNEKSA